MNNKTLKAMLQELSSIEKQMKLNADLLFPLRAECYKNHLLSAQNLIHYLTLRNIDIRLLQNELHNLGLSSLSSSESHIHVRFRNKKIGFWKQAGELSKPNRHQSNSYFTRKTKAGFLANG